MLIDGLLLAGLLWSAWRSLGSKSLLQGVFSFIVFGIILALIWARLEAFDVALAEVIIGSGISGALFLDAIAYLRRSKAKS